MILKDFQAFRVFCEASGGHVPHGEGLLPVEAVPFQRGGVLGP